MSRSNIRSPYDSNIIINSELLVSKEFTAIYILNYLIK